MVSSSTLVSDTVIFVRNLLRTNVTDPITSTRQTGSKFVMTSYPTRAVNYPIITVKCSGFEAPRKIGMANAGQIVNFELEIRIWARNVQERDELHNKVYDTLRTKQFTASTGSSANSLNEFRITSGIDLDEALGKDGEQVIRSKILTATYFFITT